MAKVIIKLAGFGKKALVPLSLIALLIVLFRPTFSWMSVRFGEENSYYSHGWLIPGAIAFLLWQRRKAIKDRPVSPSLGGFFLLLFGIFLHLSAQLLQIKFLSGWGLLTTVLGLIWFHWGPARFRLLAGPLLLIIFMVPLPGIWVIALTFRLKFISGAVGVALARLTGIEVWQNGVEVILPTAPPGAVLTLGDPCSGLRSLISFTALGFFLALMLPLPREKKYIVFATAFVLAPISNVVRVWGLIILRQTIGPAVLEGFWHIALGIGIYLLCFLVILEMVRWLLR